MRSEPSMRRESNVGGCTSTGRRRLGDLHRPDGVFPPMRRGGGNRTYPAVVGRKASLRSEAFGVSFTLRRRPRVIEPANLRGGKLGGERRASAARLKKAKEPPRGGS